MNAQQEAVAFWKFLESRGVRPSIRKVVAMMRVATIKIDEADAGRWLAPFAAANPHPKAIRSKIPANAQQPSSTPAEEIQHIASSSSALYARDKVSLPTKPIPTGSSGGAEPLTLLSSVAPLEPTKAEKVVKPRRVPSAADLEAYRLLDGLWSRISPHLNPGAYTAAIWKRNHKRIALEMLEGGVPVEDWFAFWDECADADRPYRVLKNFQAGFANRRGHRAEAAEQNASDALPSASELRTPEENDALRRKVAASRPSWFTPQMAEA